MSLRKIFSLIAMVIIVYLIINMFLVPYIYSEPLEKSFAFWGFYDESEMLLIPIMEVIVLGIAFIATLLQLCGVLKDSKLAYFGVGYCLASNLEYLVSYGQTFENSSVSMSAGSWLGVIFAAIAFVVLLIGNLLSNEKKPKQYNNYYAPNNGNNAPIVGYDPNTGDPIYAKPKGYNPRTGEPIYN